MKTGAPAPEKIAEAFAGFSDLGVTAGVIGHDAAPPPAKWILKPPMDDGGMSVAGADSRSPNRRRVAGMAHFAGLDVSIEETAVCVVDDQERC